MSENRLSDYLEHMRQAATDACSFLDAMNKQAAAIIEKYIPAE